MTCRAVLIFIVFALGLPDTMRAAQPRKPATDLSGTWSVVATFKGPPGAPDGGVRATITFKQRDVTENQTGPVGRLRDVPGRQRRGVHGRRG